MWKFYIIGCNVLSIFFSQCPHVINVLLAWIGSGQKVHIFVYMGNLSAGLDQGLMLTTKWPARVELHANNYQKETDSEV